MASKTGAYSARNGGRDAPVHRVASSDGANLGEDFPMLCGTCLGENPYVRMVKLPFGDKICKISNNPYQGFRWKAGPHGRYKETIISYAVAAERNICQTCLNDMKYNLPVGLRDQLLKDTSDYQAVVSIPQSQVGSKYYYDQQAQLMASGDHPSQQDNPFAVDLNNAPASRQLVQFSQNMQNVVQKSATRTAFRNLPKLCSFWINSACNRVIKKSCPFRPCCGPTAYAFPEIAGSDRELHAELVKLLKEKGPAELQKSIPEDIKKALSIALKGGNRDDAIRKRVSGEDDLTKHYLGKMKNMNMELEVPEDPANVTLWLGNIEADILENDIRDAIYAFGVIVNIFISRPGKCAFVEFLNRPMAEYAAKNMYHNCTIKGHQININWSKPKPIAINSSSSSSSSATGGSESSGEVIMMAPPGLEKAPPSAYSVIPTFMPFQQQPPSLQLPSSSSSSSQAPLSIPPPPTSLPPPLLQQQPPYGMNMLGKRPADHTSSSSSSVKQAKINYPSMNPDRLGATK